MVGIGGKENRGNRGKEIKKGGERERIGWLKIGKNKMVCGGPTSHAHHLYHGTNHSLIYP